jgi:hypothetical protein
MSHSARHLTVISTVVTQVLPWLNAPSLQDCRRGGFPSVHFTDEVIKTQKVACSLCKSHNSEVKGQDVTDVSLSLPESKARVLAVWVCKPRLALALSGLEPFQMPQ